MSDSKQEINGLLITGLLAVFGTVAGGVVNGMVNVNLAAQKFQQRPLEWCKSRGL